MNKAIEKEKNMENKMFVINVNRQQDAQDVPEIQEYAESLPILQDYRMSLQEH